MTSSNTRFVRNLEEDPITIEDRITILAELMRFATYKNLTFMQRDNQATSSDSSETEEILEGG